MLLRMDETIDATNAQEPEAMVVNGFKVIRALDCKNPSRTLLVQRSASSEAAVLKFTAAQSLESELLESVAHPGICQLIGSGKQGDKQYVLLSYYGEQNLLDRVEQGLSIGDFQHIVLRVAAALEHLHAQGYAHGDLRPEHVLMRNQEHPVLIDFDCTYALHSADVSNTVNSSPAYLSPERIRPSTTNATPIPRAAADFYSLGVMAYQLLSGRLPFTDESVEATLQAHLQDNVPKLPAHLQDLQPLIDGLMHKDPTRRIVSRAGIKSAMGPLRKSAELLSNVIRSAAIDTSELGALFADLRLRPDELARQTKRLRSKRRRRIALQSTLTILLAGVLLAGLLTFREELLPVVEEAAAALGVIENPALTAAWREAQSLASDPNQGLSTIVAAYRRVIELAPDYENAQLALDATEKSWKQSITAAMAVNELEQAQTRLTEAQSVFAADPELTVLSLSLQNRFRAERLLISTESLLRSSGLSDEASAGAAIQAFEEILRIAPDHVAATKGLTQIGQHYGQLSAQAARDGDVAEAIRLLQQATAARSDLRELDQVRQLISQATSIQSAIAELLATAQQLRAQNRLISTDDENAAQIYLRVLATDPDNASAASGLAQITTQVMEQIQDLLDQGAINLAQARLDLAAEQGLGATPIANMRERIDSEITRRRQIAIGLEQANVLFAQGFITAPEQDNTVAKLREVLSLDPGNEEAQKQLLACANRLAQVAQQAQQAGMVLQAKTYLDLALELQPDMPLWLAWSAEWER